MHTHISSLYGLTATFLITNVRYVQPIPTEADYIPEQEEGEEPVPALPAALINKLREGAFEGRRKRVDQQRADEATVWPRMWDRMSLGSQSKVREQDGFQEAFLRLDCVTLWRFIRETHLTHVFGPGDPMAEVNAQEQETRYATLKQGDREFVSTFKRRFDHQVQANMGAGVPEITDSKRALDFVMKLDPRRYGGMISQMKNDALREIPDAYPQSLGAAFRIASGWTGDRISGGTSGQDAQSAFLADTAFVTTKPKGPSSRNRRREKGKEFSSSVLHMRQSFAHSWQM